MKLIFKIRGLPSGSARFDPNQKTNVPLYFIGNNMELDQDCPDHLWFCWNEYWEQMKSIRKYNVIYKLKKL